jgi:LAO/AO transport system kinase
VRALARAISTVENRAPGWSELLKALFPHSGQARVLGLTGPPGAGKSTLVDQLARFYRKDNRRTVGIIAVIAVDPTSPYTGGAILGDRIRMQDHFSDPGIYIRSMATRGSLGGLARTTADVTTVLDASGRDLIMIETVGVGQDEVDIVRLAEVTIRDSRPRHGRRCADHQSRHHGNRGYFRDQQERPRRRRARGERDSHAAIASDAP